METEKNFIPRVATIIVTWNSLGYLYECMESLINQSEKNISIIVVDNGSADGTCKFLREHYPRVTVLQNFKNMGFSYANNQGIKLSKSEYILIMNPDVVLEKNFIKELVSFADKHTRGGSFGGKLLKMKTQNIDPDAAGVRDLLTYEKTSVIDSAGLVMRKDRTPVNRGEGKSDSGQYPVPEQIFGVSGCCGLYRREALEDVKIFDEYFDNDFFAYKEDVDLAYRLKIYGWESWFVPDAQGFHARGFSAPVQLRGKLIRKSRKNISRLIRSLSFWNQRFMLLKNEYSINAFFHIFFIIKREIGVIFYIIFFEPFILLEIIPAIKQIPKIYAKRKIIQARKMISARALRSWFK